MLKQLVLALVLFAAENSVVCPDPNEGRASLLSQHLKRMSQTHLKLADVQVRFECTYGKRLSFLIVSTIHALRNDSL